MKKLCLALMALAASSAALAKDIYNAEEHPGTFLEIALATPLQLPSSDWEVDGLRLNLIHGTSFGVYGLDIGLLGMNNASGAGLAVDALSGWTFGDYYGLQIASLGNVVMGEAAGWQIAGGCNYVNGEFYGVQFAPVNIDGSFWGLQTGVLNYSKGESFGLQLGPINVEGGEIHGWSVGVFNYAERFDGLQLGVLNIAGDKGNGLQLGVFNCAKSYYGVQIGVLNVIDRGDFPILPFINVQF